MCKNVHVIEIATLLNRGSIDINFMNFAQFVEKRSMHVRSVNRKKTLEIAIQLDSTDNA